MCIEVHKGRAEVDAFHVLSNTGLQADLIWVGGMPH